MNSSTASPQEIAKFNALAAEWWDPAGPMAPLHQMNPLRCAWIATRLAERHGRSSLDLQGLRLLDVGCGAGLASEGLARFGADVTGLDAAEEAITAARLHAQDQGLAIDYRQGAPEELANEGAMFDAVVALEVIEHVQDRAQFMTALATLVRPGGFLFMSTINRTARSYLTAKIGAEYVLRWLPKGTHDWNQFVSPGELGTVARAHGFFMSDLTGMTFDGRAWTASGDVSVNYIAALQRC
ncbi:bifunctional 2-polyprenyl-6-hydroxyphenol methylase/3-demethylubiquinol 3-O-methyltransferase UbiG [Pseudoroseomonas globiformis]|uniref:Ubiquinone biosynthesis O-methyltransferase n=1 Tax=Teichococcus globiformis TaxID=2307229 RepID=A0ABV7G359_9PROT